MKLLLSALGLLRATSSLRGRRLEGKGREGKGSFRRERNATRAQNLLPFQTPATQARRQEEPATLISRLLLRMRRK